MRNFTKGSAETTAVSTTARVAVVSHHSPSNADGFSGIPYFLFRALEAAAESVTYIELPTLDLESVLAGDVVARREMKALGEVTSKTLESVDADFVLGLGGAAIPYLQTNLPIIHWHDSTWSALLRLPHLDFAHRYPFLADWDQATLDKSAVVAFAAHWLRDHTLQNYGADPRRVVVVPFGANLLGSVDAKTRALPDKDGGPVNLLFVGADWRRKGLVLAHHLLIRLLRQGILASLTVIGPVMVETTDATISWTGDGGDLELAALRTDRHVRMLGFIDKRTANGRDAYHAALCDAHFLVHPASFGCFGIALAEAATYGIPVLGIDSYGPSSIVDNGITGHLFAPEDFVDGASSAILTFVENPHLYTTVSAASIAAAKARLNWKSSVQTLLNTMSKLNA